MRWLGALAVLLVGAAIYLYIELSSSSATPSPRSDAPAPKTEPAAVPDSAAAAKPSPAPVRPANIPTPTVRSEDKRVASSSPAPRVEDTPTAPADAGDPDVPWTEAERQQWLWTATGRFEKGNYPRALEASLEIARRNPGTAWEQDALSLAVKSYCAMSEPDKASALFAKITDQTGIEGAVKSCAEWNVKLAKSP